MCDAANYLVKCALRVFETRGIASEKAPAAVGLSTTLTFVPSLHFPVRLQLETGVEFVVQTRMLGAIPRWFSN